MSGYQGWTSLLMLPGETPATVVFAVSMVVFFLVALVPLALVMNFVERKMTADLQARVGPNRAGGNGFLQALSDMLKMLSKASVTPESRRARFWMAVQNGVLYTSFAALPLGSTLIFLNSELNALVPFVSFGLYFLFQGFIGIEGRSIEELLLGFRGGFQFLAGLIPATICAFVAAIHAGSFNWTAIGESQNGGPLAWMAFSNPFGFVTSVAFMLSGLLMFQFPPFHSLDRGMSRLSATQLALHRFNQFYASLAWSIFTVVFFYGAWDYFGERAEGFVGAALEMFSVLAKACVLNLLAKVVAKALPQIRTDQMTDFSWKVLTPISLICLLGMSLWVVGVGR